MDEKSNWLVPTLCVGTAEFAVDLSPHARPAKESPAEAMKGGSEFQPIRSARDYLAKRHGEKSHASSGTSKIEKKMNE
jgi:hypothetical protein